MNHENTYQTQKLIEFLINARKMEASIHDLANNHNCPTCQNLAAAASLELDKAISTTIGALCLIARLNGETNAHPTKT